MVDVLASYEKLADWRDHDPRQRTTNYLLDGEPYGGATHPMRSSGSRGLVHYTGVHHTSQSRRLTFSPRAIIVPEDFAELDRQERVPRTELDGMFERQPIEQYIYDTTGKEVAIRTVMRERQSPFNGERDKPRVESNIVTIPLFKTRQQRVLETVGAGAVASPNVTPTTTTDDVSTFSQSEAEAAVLAMIASPSLSGVIKGLADQTSSPDSMRQPQFEAVTPTTFSVPLPVPTALPSPPARPLPVPAPGKTAVSAHVRSLPKSVDPSQPRLTDMFPSKKSPTKAMGLLTFKE